MFKVLTLEAKNFRSFQDVHMELGGEPSAFIGPMGTGKSTAEEIIKYLIAGVTRMSGDHGQGSIEALRWGAKPEGRQKYPRMVCRGTFAVDGRTYRIIRAETEERSELGFEMYDDTNVYPLKGQKDIERIFFSGASAADYIRKVEARALASAPVAERRRLLYEAISQNITLNQMKEAVLDVCDVRNVLNSDQEILGDAMQDVLVKYSAESLDDVELRFSTLFDICVDTLVNKGKELTFDGLDKTARDARPAVKRDNDRIEDILKILKSTEAPVFLTPERLDAMRAEIAHAEAEGEVVDKLRIAASAQEEKVKARLNVESTVALVQKMITDNESRRDGAVKNKLKAEDELKRTRLDIDALVNSSETSDRAKHIVDKLKASIEEQQAAARVIVENLSAKIAEKVELEARIIAREQQAEELKTNRKVKQEVCPDCGETLVCSKCGVTVGPDKEAIKVKLSEIRSDISVKKKKISKIEEKIVALRDSLTKVELDIQRDRDDITTHQLVALRDISGERVLLEKRIIDIEESVALWGKEIVQCNEDSIKHKKDLVSAQKQLTSMEMVEPQNIAELDRKKTELKDQASAWRAKLAQAEQAIAHADSNREEILALEIKHAQNLRDYRVYDELIRAFGPSGARARIMSVALGDLAGKANTILNELLGMEIIFGGPEGVDVKIKKDGAVLDIQQLSEGQFAAVALCLQAVAANENPILVDGLDVMEEQEMCSLLGTLSAFSASGVIGQVFVATCRDYIRSYFPRVFFTEIRQGISTITDVK